MPSEESGLQHRDNFRRPVPRCYSRSRMAKAISESRIDTESNVVLVGLSVVTCIATFVVVYGGWGF
jgi:hypothetical protein